MRCPVRSRYPNQPQRSFIVLVDANDYASSSRNTNFKPLVLDEIQTVGDTDGFCHARSRSARLPVFEARDVPGGLDSAGMVCMAIAVLKGRGPEPAPSFLEGQPGLIF